MIDYIEGKVKNGIKYDWNLIKKDMRALKIPKEFHNPSNLPLESLHWFVEMSDRSRGKTTNWLLLGMGMHMRYGTTIEYVRQIEDMITPKNSKDIFKTILDLHYVEKVTNNRWNSVFYKSRRWYLCNRDEDGNVVEQENTHFMMMLSIDKADVLKSSYSAPKGDLIIFDEFIGRYGQRNEFVYFCDLVKTIIRERQCPLIALLSNTIDKNSIYFNELEISDNVASMKQGCKEIITTAKGTKIYFEILAKVTIQNNTRSRVNSLFFGFKNPRMSSITGDDWAVDNYPHIPIFANEKTRLLDRKHYLQFSNKLVNIELWECETRGLIACLHFASKTYDDSIIYTLGTIENKNQRYKLGHTKLDNLVWNLCKKNKFYYATNDVGALVDKYLHSIKEY